MRAYDLHGLRLAVTGWEAAAAALHGRLEGLPSATAGEPDLVFEIGVGPGADEGLERPERGRPVYEPPAGEVLFDDAADRIWIGLGPDRRAVCEPARGRARLWARQGSGEDAWLLSHPLFTLPLVEMLKRRELWALHAAGLQWKGRTLVLAGASGSGKSTLAIALARAGFAFLGDDTLFLQTFSCKRSPALPTSPPTPLPSPPRRPGEGRPRPTLASTRQTSSPLSRGMGGRWERGAGGVRPGGGPAPAAGKLTPMGPGGEGTGLRLLAFPDEVDLTDETAAFFPELAALPARREGWRKRRLRAEETYGAPLAGEVGPGLLVFPRISGRTESALAPLDPGEALIELASNVLLTEPASSQAHLDALAALAAASSCWRLETGRDLDGAVRLLRDLAEQPVR